MLQLRQRTAQILGTHHHGDRTGKLVNFFLISLISLNVVSIVLESEPALLQAYRPFFLYFEWFSVAVFTVEYLARLWSCIDLEETLDRRPVMGRLKYMLTPLAVIDLIAILPFYMGLYLTVDLRFLRVMRLLRLLKLSRYSTAMGALLDVLQEEAQTLLAAFVVLVMMLVISASGIHLLEAKLQPEAFGSIPSAMWWSITTLTTVGYGDVTPITPMGKMFGAFIMLIGVGMVALPAAILASGFAENMRKRRIQYNAFIKHALSDGRLDDEERWQLEQLREELGLSREESIHLVDALVRSQLARQQVTCPHCGKDFTIHVGQEPSPDNGDQAG